MRAGLWLALQYRPLRTLTTAPVRRGGHPSPCPCSMSPTCYNPTSTIAVHGNAQERLDLDGPGSAEQRRNDAPSPTGFPCQLPHSAQVSHCRLERRMRERCGWLADGGPVEQPSGACRTQSSWNLISVKFLSSLVWCDVPNPAWQPRSPGPDRRIARLDADAALVFDCWSDKTGRNWSLSGLIRPAPDGTGPNKRSSRLSSIKINQCSSWASAVSSVSG